MTIFVPLSKTIFTVKTQQKTHLKTHTAAALETRSAWSRSRFQSASLRNWSCPCPVCPSPGHPDTLTQYRKCRMRKTEVPQQLTGSPGSEEVSCLKWFWKTFYFFVLALLLWHTLLSFHTYTHLHKVLFTWTNSSKQQSLGHGIYQWCCYPVEGRGTQGCWAPTCAQHFCLPYICITLLLGVLVCARHQHGIIMPTEQFGNF